ncbi:MULTISPECIES: dephospho-CoA kinase [Brevibacterium]|uniref:Dephospho-CoA kinase n=2 Tax=Brevibacterium TaxID=1696 RepID=A0A2H1L2C0_9MICO|nr:MULTISPECIES: dephospho-CoA kinase [Brevibacterium]TWC02918.1 dephospho-CoA kinase [Brevibacterium jeotgali]SLM98344.1 Dephospho-CoA kinase [Brevibacterium yomogidense]SMY10940.1 dephospho-CoA kinase [Brevibacterium jeotgali]
MTDSQRALGPLLIGLTGGIGAGKSTVASLFRSRGAAVVDADAIAREVVEPGEPALLALTEEFGDGILTEAGELDRAALATAAFASADRTAALNAIMHPAIGDRTHARMAELADHGVVVHDVPLLVENGMTARYHLSVLVDVSEDIRLERLTTSRGLDREDALRRIRAQAADEQRRRACDAILDNSTTEQQLEARFSTLWEERIEPFRRHRAAGTPAQPSELAAGETSSEAQEAAGARLVARIERAASAAGMTCTATHEPGPQGVEIALSVVDGDTASRVRSVLADVGFAPVAEDAAPHAATERYAHTDPGRPAFVSVS